MFNMFILRCSLYTLL